MHGSEGGEGFGPSRPLSLADLRHLSPSISDSVSQLRCRLQLPRFARVTTEIVEIVAVYRAILTPDVSRLRSGAQSHFPELRADARIVVFSRFKLPLLDCAHGSILHRGRLCTASLVVESPWARKRESTDNK